VREEGCELFGGGGECGSYIRIGGISNSDIELRGSRLAYGHRCGFGVAFAVSGDLEEGEVALLEACGRAEADGGDG
jgi:hypothetical protein